MTYAEPIAMKGVVLACNVSTPSPASAIFYTIAVNMPRVGRTVLEQQVPSYWRWPDTMDTDGQALVGKPVSGTLLAGVLYWEIIERPHFKFCPGEGQGGGGIMIDPTTGMPMPIVIPPPGPSGPSTPTNPTPPTTGQLPGANP